MTTPTNCYPWWHAKFAPMAAGQQVTLQSGCGVDAQGNINCDPEAMRANAEAQLRAAGVLTNLSLETYTLARYLNSEVGDGTVEARVAVAEAAINRAKLERLPQGIISLLLLRQPSQRYGAINVKVNGVKIKTGRWASTSRDPTILAILLAEFVLSGASDNFNNGADDQDGLEFQEHFPVPMNRILGEAQGGKYWVGPLPGIDHWHTTQFRTFGFKPNSPEGLALIERARQVFGAPEWSNGKIVQSLRPVWPANLPVCGKSISPLWGIALLGAIFGGWWAMRNTTTTHAV